ncbi:protein moonraker-like isoform X1 [Acipenser ruthenus]|uniref:protein moonraker-like isoform X1 n=1 Tax=Acipenser ruthenus TaxID=7906 RepID=UPI0027427BFD|nr:protein moonraker-like isoform X1 [Acipenser ruthenus]
MDVKLQNRPAQVTFGEPSQLNGSWVLSGSGKIQAQSKSQLQQTQLRFNKEVPTSPSNLSTRFLNPAPIVIEKLAAPGTAEARNGSSQWEDSVSSSQSSVRFSVVSEDRLQRAVRMAQRDMRRRQQEEASATPSAAQRKPSRANIQDQHSQKQGLRQSQTPKAEITKSGARVIVYTPERLSHPAGTETTLSPPTRDPGPGPKPRGDKQEPGLSLEIRRLQKELGTYIQRIEQMANRGRGQALDPDEERRAQIRRQEQAVRSARIIYMLQQQVKQIQEDLDRLSPHKIRHTKKSRAMDRLAAAHRGAVRAMQLFVGQLSDQSEEKVPSHYRELGQLIRQLSLCSAKLEAGSGSSVPETAIDILQQLEDLDCALGKQESPRRQASRARSSSPPVHTASRGRQRSASPTRGRRGQRGPGKLTTATAKTSAERRAVSVVADRSQSELGPPRKGDPPTPQRSEVLRASIETLSRMGALKKETPEPPRPAVLKGVLLADRPKGFRQPREVHFQKTTLASRLKENQPPLKDSSIPWVPPHPTSPPASPRRATWKKQGAGVQSSPPRAPGSPGRHRETVELERRQLAEHEALRQAWLDNVTARRLRDLKELCREETEQIQRLRAEAGSPTRWAERAEQAAQERLRPLLDRAQQISSLWERKGTSLRNRLSAQVAETAAGSAELLSEKILDDLLEDTAQALWAVEQDRQAERGGLALQDSPSLETMLRRMEEMEKDEDSVRRRFAHVTYAGPEFWVEEERADRGQDPADRKPTTPQPIRITKLAGHKEPVVDIVIETPTETNVLSEESGWGDLSQRYQPRQPLPQAKQRDGTFLSVPIRMQQSIQKYSERYEAFLRLVSHEAVGSFNPWVIADSLAEELMSEALGDVAAEFQDVCEEYAEAVFTSEFLQPIQSQNSIPGTSSQ